MNSDVGGEDLVREAAPHDSCWANRCSGSAAGEANNAAGAELERVR